MLQFSTTQVECFIHSALHKVWCSLWWVHIAGPCSAYGYTLPLKLQTGGDSMVSGRLVHDLFSTYHHIINAHSWPGDIGLLHDNVNKNVNTKYVYAKQFYFCLHTDLWACWYNTRLHSMATITLTITFNGTLFSSLLNTSHCASTIIVWKWRVELLWLYHSRLVKTLLHV